MFSKHGQRLYKHSADHQVFAISLPNLKKVGLKKHPEVNKKVNFDEIAAIAGEQEKLFQKTGSYKFTGNLIVAAVPKRGSVLNYRYIILDGVHRYKAAELLDHPNDVTFIVEVLRFDDYAKMIQEFQRINKETPQHLHVIKPNIEVAEAVDKFTSKCPEFESRSDDIKDSLIDSPIGTELETAEKLYDALLEIQDALYKKKAPKTAFSEDTLDILREETAKQRLLDAM